MFPLMAPLFTADGNIRPNRFLCGSGSGTTKFCKVIEAADSTAPLVGVSGDGVRGPQPAGAATGSTNDTTYLAIAGDPVPASTAGMEGNLLLAGTVSDWRIPLTATTGGAGIAVTPTSGTLAYYGAIALEPGVSGDVIKVWVLPPCPQI